MLQNYRSGRNITSFSPAAILQAAGESQGVAARAANLSTVEIVERHFGKHTGLPHSTKAWPELNGLSRNDDSQGPAPMNAHQKIAFSCSPTSKPVGADARADMLKDPGFGRFSPDHRVPIRGPQDRRGHAAQGPAGEPISLDPAAAVLHYGQEIF